MYRITAERVDDNGDVRPALASVTGSAEYVASALAGLAREVQRDANPDGAPAGSPSVPVYPPGVRENEGPRRRGRPPKNAQPTSPPVAQSAAGDPPAPADPAVDPFAS